jgi:hypothetical protein
MQQRVLYDTAIGADVHVPPSWFNCRTAK